MNKKVISLLLVFAMALSLAVPGVTLEAKAAGEVPVTVSSASGKPGDTVKVSVSFGISETQPVRSAQFKLRYDANKLTVVSTDYTSKCPKGLRLIYTDTPGTVNWGWADTEAYTAGGVWVTITFRINKDATGTAPLTFYNTLCSEDSTTPNYKLAITDGKITIQNSSSSNGGGGGGAVAPGNTNGDKDDTNVLDTPENNGTVTKPGAKVTKIKFTAKKSKIKVKKTYRFKAKTIGKKATITWSVSNKKIGIINKKTGKFRAKKPGTVTVYAKAGGKTAKVKVKVTK